MLVVAHPIVPNMTFCAGSVSGTAVDCRPGMMALWDGRFSYTETMNCAVHLHRIFVGRLRSAIPVPLMRINMREIDRYGSGWQHLCLSYSTGQLAQEESLRSALIARQSLLPRRRHWEG